MSIIVIKMRLSYNWLQLEDSDYLSALSEKYLLSEGKNSLRTYNVHFPEAIKLAIQNSFTSFSFVHIFQIQKANLYPFTLCSDPYY